MNAPRRKRAPAFAEPDIGLSPAQGEAWFRKECGSLLIGLDEAGRGPLAGPVVAAAVILPSTDCLSALNDSKKLSERAREELYPQICAQAVRWAIAQSTAAEIDQINILQASFLAMRRALYAIGWEHWLPGGNPGSTHILSSGGVTPLPTPLPDALLLVDGNHCIAGIEVPRQRPLIKGDGRIASIAAASILAKVTRDRLLVELDKKYPIYGFAGHKGYPSPSHLSALETHGPCPAHRLSFRPLRNQQTDLFG